MKESDRLLGMDRDITRRDFIHDMSAFALALGLPIGALGGEFPPDPGAGGAYYPPTRTGMRGSHPGSFEVAHSLARGGRRFDHAINLDENYDLVVVGGGLSGLAAAYFYRKLNGPDSRILVLDNHDDFGGHAKRNEFHQGGPMRLAWGGTVNMEFPKYSKVARGLIDELGVDIPRLVKESEYSWEGGVEGLKYGTWFDAEHYGRDVFLPGVRLAGMPPEALAARLDEFPLPEAAREALRAFLLYSGDALEGMSDAEKASYLSSTSYADFLRDKFQLPEAAVQPFLAAPAGYWGVPADNLSVTECLSTGLPGAHALGGYRPHTEESGEPGVREAMFPDGNASLTRLLVRSLIPAAFPGFPASADPHDVVTAALDYAKLDEASSKVRVRLNSTAVHAENTSDGVAVTYVTGGKTLRITGSQCVLACYNAMIPFLCPDLPETQKQALHQCVKRPMLIINVLLRDGHALAKSGIVGASLPARLCQSVRLVTGVNAGQYRPKWRPEDPCVMQFYAAVFAPEPAGLDMTERNRQGRYRLLGMHFEDYEREIRTVLNGLLEPGGFKAADDILAIMVDRWPHGYARDHLDLEDPAWNADPPPNVVGRQPFGKITIANSDAGADAYTHTAFDQAWRAVNELRS